MSSKIVTMVFEELSISDIICLLGGSKYVCAASGSYIKYGKNLDKAYKALVKDNNHLKHMKGLLNIGDNDPPAAMIDVIMPFMNIERSTIISRIKGEFTRTDYVKIDKSPKTDFELFSDALFLKLQENSTELDISIKRATTPKIGDKKRK